MIIEFSSHKKKHTSTRRFYVIEYNEDKVVTCNHYNFAICFSDFALMVTRCFNQL